MASDNGPRMLCTPSTSAQENWPFDLRPVSLKDDGLSARGSTDANLRHHHAAFAGRRRFGQQPGLRHVRCGNLIRDACSRVADLLFNTAPTTSIDDHAFSPNNL